jgi:N-acetylglucosamine transport system substrate-binding protein
MRGNRFIWIISGVAALAMMAGCNNGGEESKGSGETLTVKVFSGGYGHDFFEDTAEDFAEERGLAGSEVEGDPRMWDRLRPDFVAGTPPDVAWPGWGMDYWALVYDGKIEPMDDYLDQPAYGEDSGTWRDTFDPDLMKLGQHDGKQYLMPFHVNLNGWWYNQTLFEEKGWTMPSTFEELLELGPKMQAEGIAPLTYQGQYPYYMLYGFIYPWVISSGGIDAWNDCQGLVPGAWKSEHMLKAAQSVELLRDSGFFLEGSLAMDHIASETEFLKGNAAMVPVGTWFYAEMAGAWPTGLVAEFMLPPPYADGKGDPSALMVAIEPFIIPSDAKNKQLGVDYYKYITSKDKARQFVEEKGTLMSITGLDDAVYAPYLETPARLFEQAKVKWHSEYRFWYPALAEEASNSMSALLAGDIDAETFCERIEAKAEETRNDESIIKHTVE